MDQETLGQLWTELDKDPTIAPILIDALIDAGQNEAAKSVLRGDYDKVVISSLNPTGEVVYWRGHWVFPRSLAVVFPRMHADHIITWLSHDPRFVDHVLIEAENL